MTREEQRLLRKSIQAVNEQGWGISVGLLFGLGLLVATNLLVLKGGDRVGPHLSLLSVYFPGYRVSFLGSLIGFVYAFVVGYGVGRTITSLYNRLTARMR